MAQNWEISPFIPLRITNLDSDQEMMFVAATEYSVFILLGNQDFMETPPFLSSGIELTGRFRQHNATFIEQLFPLTGPSEARSAEHSRADFVCPVLSGRDWCGGPWRAARRADRSRSDFVCPGMSGRDWCRGPWRAGPSVRGRTLFVRAMSLSYGYCLHRGWDGSGAFLCQRRAKVTGNFVKRSNELSEQSEELLAAQRKRAAVKVSNECSKDREERLSQARTILLTVRNTANTS